MLELSCFDAENSSQWEGTHPNAVLEPEVLRAMSDLEAAIESDVRVRAVVSIADQVKRMHRAMQGGDRAGYVIPDNPRLIAQYALLYGMAAGPDGLGARMKVVGCSEIQCRYVRTRKQQLLGRFPRDWPILFLQAYVRGRKNDWRPRSEGNVTWVTVPAFKSIPNPFLRRLLDLGAVRAAATVVLAVWVWCVRRR